MTKTDAVVEFICRMAEKGRGPESVEPVLYVVLAEFESAVRADERIKATAEAYEKIARTMVPRGSVES